MREHLGGEASEEKSHLGKKQEKGERVGNKNLRSEPVSTKTKGARWAEGLEYLSFLKLYPTSTSQVQVL